jgi:hypothetical protein
MTLTESGIRLVGGPAPFDGWANAYPTEQLGGWPLPDELAIGLVTAENMEIVIVAIVNKVPEKDKHLMYLYRKIGESGLPEGAANHPNIIRGAVYKYVKEGLD